MSANRGGLGRNLSALLRQPGVQLNSNLSAEEQTQIQYLSITSLSPGKFQPRQAFSTETITELAESIRQQGLLQPLVVRALDQNHYEILAGERRWRACQQLGMSRVPVILRQVNDETAIALALIENIQREDLSVMDQARAMQRLLSDFGMSHQQIATVLAKSRAAVTNHLRLLNLSPAVQAWLDQGALDMGHARSLLTLSDQEQQRIANLVVTKGLTVRETERLVTATKTAHTPTAQVPKPYPDLFQAQLDKIGQHLHTEVRLKPGGAERGTVVIHYTDLVALETILAKILG